MKLLGIILAAFLLTGSLVNNTLAATQRLSVTEIGTSDGAQSWVGSGGGNYLTGYITVGGRSHGYIATRKGELIDLGTMGGPNSFGMDILPSGKMVGYSQTSQGTIQSYVGHMKGKKFDRTLLPLYGTDKVAVARSLTPSGKKIAGYTQDVLMSSNTRAIMWPDEDSAPILLGSFGGQKSEAFAINPAGWIVGWADQADGNRKAFITRGDGNLQMLNPIPGLVKSSASAISNQGHVVGSSSTANNRHRATAWFKAGAPTDLGDLDGIYPTVANSISENGFIVGHAFIDRFFNTRGWIWSEKDGMQNLNSLIDPSSGWVIVSANKITNDGTIYGAGRFNNGPIRGVVLTRH